MPVNIVDRSAYLAARPPRVHPYRKVHHDDRGGYYDFKRDPDSIETSLEDFAAHAGNPGVQDFYELLRYVNRPEAPFETTDCGLSQRLHVSKNSPFPDKAGWVGGRVMLMWRDIERNCRSTSVTWLRNQLLQQFKRYRRRHDYVGFALGPFPTVFSASGAEGHQIDIEFAMWGDTYEEALDRFRDVVAILDKVLRRVERHDEERRRSARARRRKGG